MGIKLTLSIEEDVIIQAKKYAKKEGRSLSSIVEEYLKSISGKRKKYKSKEDGFHPLVEELSGSVKIPEDASYKKLIGDAKVEKYLKR